MDNLSNELNKLRPSHNNPGRGHENGDVEQAHHRFKRAVDTSSKAAKKWKCCSRCWPTATNIAACCSPATCYAVHRITGLMRRVLLCGLSSVRARNHRYPGRFSLRIKERLVREAISLSLARKRPDRSFGAMTASSASSLMEGSTRV